MSDSGRIDNDQENETELYGEVEVNTQEYDGEEQGEEQEEVYNQDNINEEEQEGEYEQDEEDQQEEDHGEYEEHEEHEEGQYEGQYEEQGHYDQAVGDDQAYDDEDHVGYDQEYEGEHSDEESVEQDHETDPYYNDDKPATPYGGSRILYVEVEHGNEIVTENCEVFNQCKHKPFLGGYRHKETMVEFHHASCQTDPLKRKKKNQSDVPVHLSHRCTQTVKTKDVSQQTYREQGTQMAKPGLAIDNSNDRIYICTGKYFSADELLNLRTEKAIFLQSWVRGCLARKKCSEKRQEKIENIERENEEAATKAEKEKKRRIREQQRRDNPKTAKDFEILYNELEDWRLAETERVRKTARTKAERRLGMVEILRKETKVLQVIDRLKNAAAKENQKKAIAKKLEKMANPKKLKNYDGEHTAVETPFTVRAAELMDLYHSLNTTNVSVDERLDVLLHVKWTVKEFDCILTRDIVELIDREGDMLNRGRSDRAMEGMRKRLSNLFLQFIETPEFNPLASSLKNSTIQFANVQPIEK
mmetsp:Transcript_8776/g.13000  ORF Transcript_8776/g.13000 Transcript_8776/m.13000 type:complete len:530 (-) Transcript_8776:22-1611(-)